jgi:hypothetical protein
MALDLLDGVEEASPPANLKGAIVRGDDTRVNSQGWEECREALPFGRRAR